MSSRKFVIFAWSGNLHEYICLCFGLGCSQDIFKTIKGTNSSTEADEHLSSDIFRRHSSDEKNIRGNFNEQRHIDISASTSGFCHKPEKISSETITINKDFRPKNRYSHHDFGTNRGKDGKGNFEM